MSEVYPEVEDVYYNNSLNPVWGRFINEDKHSINRLYFFAMEWEQEDLQRPFEYDLYIVNAVDYTKKVMTEGISPKSRAVEHAYS